MAGFFLGIGQPLTMSLIVQAVPDDARGTALAIRLFGNRVGQVATPAVAGLVAGAAGIAAAFWLLGGCWWRLRPRWRASRVVRLSVAGGPAWTRRSGRSRP